MPVTYKNVLNLQGPPERVSVAHSEICSDSVLNFNAITPMPRWVRSNDWALENWGVHENAHCESKYAGGSQIEFETSGDVRELMRKLSLIYPDLYVDYIWASGDVGKDSGMTQFRDGEVTFENVPEPLSSAAYELAFDIFGEPAENFGLRYDPTKGTYIYTGNFIRGEDADETTEKEK